MVSIDGIEVLTELEEVISPSHTALLVIDFQGNWTAGSAPAEAVVANVAAVLDSARTAAVRVIYTVNVHLPRHQSISGPCLRRLLKGGYKPGEDPIPYRADPGNVKITPAIAPIQDERVIGKYRANAFMGTDLDVILRSSGIKSLVLVGRASDWCLEATLWNAIDRDYYTLVLEDCVHSARQAGHRAALEQMRVTSEVAKSTDVIAIWDERS